MNEVEWDDVKDADNLAKRGLPLRYGALLFDGPFVEEEDARKDYGESRFKAVGPIPEFADRIFVVIYTWRENKRRIISFRKANDREIREYQENVDG